MKIEQLLVQHFYNNRKVSLQGMGTFTLSPDFVPPKDEKEAEIPDNAILFEYNAKAPADDDLINYIVQQSRKMKPLAAADLDSYLVLGKQFLNIGKPFKIEGMGMLIKNQQGDLSFVKGHSFHVKPENPPATANAPEKTINPEISFASETKRTENSNRKGLLAGGALIAALLLGATAWYFFGRNSSVSNENKNLSAAVDTASGSKATSDTTSTAIPAPPVPAKEDGYTFKVVFMQTTDSAAAVSRMNVLTARKHTVIMYKKDSAMYRLAEPFTLPLADTSRIKDSLNSYYYSGKAFIELK